MDKLAHPLARGASWLLIYLTAVQPLHPAIAAGITAANGNTQVAMKPGNVTGGEYRHAQRGRYIAQHLPGF